MCSAQNQFKNDGMLRLAQMRPNGAPVFFAVLAQTSERLIRTVKPGLRRFREHVASQIRRERLRSASSAIPFSPHRSKFLRVSANLCGISLAFRRTVAIIFHRQSRRVGRRPERRGVAFRSAGRSSHRVRAASRCRMGLPLRRSKTNCQHDIRRSRL